MCAFFWYQRDPKNHINDANLPHKDKIKVSSILIKVCGRLCLTLKLFSLNLKSDTIWKSLHESLIIIYRYALKLVLYALLLTSRLVCPALAAFDSVSGMRIWFGVKIKTQQSNSMIYIHNLSLKTRCIAPAKGQQLTINFGVRNHFKNIHFSP